MNLLNKLTYTLQLQVLTYYSKKAQISGIAELYVSTRV